MNRFNLYLAGALAVSAAAPAGAEVVASFPMDVRSGQIVETVSGNRFSVQGNFAPENVPGAVGEALRFDGYTSHVDASLGNILADGATDMTVSLWVAVPCYPIIQLDTNTPEKTAIASCLDEGSKTGFGFFIGFDGKYSFRTFVGGWPVNIDIATPLSPYEWHNLTAVIKGQGAGSVKLYDNGREVGTSRASGAIGFAPASFKMGHGDASRMMGPFQLMSYNGLIDDITIWNEAIAPETIASWKPENPADLDIPESRFANDILRPRFHGMPAAGWTNECHGMTFADGCYHLFFQKNADGPYMARLHWGHISSADLCRWKEEPIALAPGAPYDIKGCWSGCVFTDDVVTGGKPNIIYTAVDYGRASIAQASPLDASLIKWEKNPSNPIIAGRPDGLSDDFRDPYFFRNGPDAYIIVGTSKDNVGAVTLHRYDQAAKSWSNTGDIFFKGSTAAQSGRFWEMPNLTPMPDGKWIFTATPLETSAGVRTLYWTGMLDSQSHFVPDPNFSSPKTVELNSRQGFGLLSPTIYNHEGKTLALGIVPDKLASEENWKLGWAHCYSLPREWSLDSDGNLLQRPFAGLVNLRSATHFSKNDFSLEGTMQLGEVSGRQVELLASFEVGSGAFGFNIFKNGEQQGTVTFNTDNATVTADFSRLQRLVNDGGVYDGVYRCSLPEFPRRGSEVKLNVFIDHSILDIFVNDKYAVSIRVFPTDPQAMGVEAFTTSPIKVKSLDAWTLTGGDSAVDSFPAEDGAALSGPVYTVDGRIVISDASPESIAALEPGLYISNSRKFLVK